MRPPFACVWLALALSAAGAAGCQDQAAQTYPADPLLSSKKPIEASAAKAPPMALVSNEPAVPAVPAMVLAAARQQGLTGPDLPGRTGLVNIPPAAH
jgi:hypothetical protein